MWANSDCAPLFEAVWIPEVQGLCSHLVQKWATSDFAPRSEAVGILEAAGVMWPFCPLLGHFCFCPPP